MKRLALLAGLLLAACGQPAFAQEPAPQEQTCGLFLQVMQAIDQQVHVEKLINLSKDKREALRDWINAMEPVTEDKFDIILVVDHGQDRYGVVMGWAKDPDASDQATICIGMIIGHNDMAKFLEITGLPGGARGTI